MTASVAPIAPPRTLVVRLPNPAGDVVLATPALRALRAGLPDTKIVWAGRGATLALLDGLRERDNVVLVEGLFREGPGAPFRLGQAWKDMGADAVLLLTGSFASAVAARASGASVRVGYARHGRRALLTHAIQPPKEGKAYLPEPMRTHYLRLAAMFGGQDDGLAPFLVATREGLKRAEERVSRDRIPAAVLAVSPGAAFGPSKIYPTRLLAAAVKLVRERSGLTPLILVGPGEESLGSELARLLGPPVISTHDDIAKWPETKALLRHAEVLLTPDAGPRHVAAALGTNVVCLMGPTDPRWSSGDEDLVTILRKEDVDCLGCHLRVCPIGHPCMRTMDPGVVAAAVLERLALSRSAGLRGPTTAQSAADEASPVVPAGNGTLPPPA